MNASDRPKEVRETDAARCPLCGARLAATGPGCLRCLLRGGLEDEEEDVAGNLAALSTADAPSSPGSARDFGDYEIARRADDGGALWELGRGAMGVTYRALDTALHVPVALKVIDADLAAHPRVQARFLREARAAAGLRHPNIAGVFRFGVCPDGRCFYAMELVEGETLEERVRRDGPLSVALALEIAEQVASALLAAEKGGVVHRDLKPSNIMLATAAAAAEDAASKPVVKVIDFGLAKAAAGTAVAAGTDIGLTQGGFIGTPGFASPEQFDPAAPLDVRSDIFSLGVTLWYLLVGSIPFVGHDLAEIRAQQTADRLPLAQLEAVRVPPAVVRLLRDCLAADLTRRPQTARALVERLHRCREECVRPSAAGAISWRNRRRPLVAAAICLVVALLGFGAVRYFHARRLPADFAAVATGRPASEETEKSIAVLPFENLSADKENAFFADGIQTDIIANLGRVAGLKVISRASVASYRAAGRGDPRETARALGVSYLLEGSVQRADRRVRVHAQLLDARTGVTLWSQRYNRDLADIFAIQDEVAERIAAELRVRLSPAERAALQAPPTADLAAYDLHLRARQLLDAFTDTFRSREMVPEAIHLLDDALARDPAFLRAWCDLTKAHMDLYWYGFDRTPERLALAGAALTAALRLNPDAGETHLALAEYHYHGFRDYDRARTELALARLTLPNRAEIPFLAGVLDRRQGRWDDSERNLRRALELDPRNTKIHEQLAINLRCQRRYAECGRVLDAALAIAPGSVPLRQARARLDLDARADPRPLREALAATLREDPAAAGEVAEGVLECALCERDAAAAERALALVSPGGIPVHGGTFPRTWFEALMAHSFGEGTRARAAFEAARVEAERAVRAQPDFAFAQSVLGLIDAGLGNREEAIQAGRRAVELMPVSRDAIEAPEELINLAIILAWSSEPDLAVDELEAAARIPSRLSYGLLKLHPQWDPLRGNTRFEALVAKLDPATSGGPR